MNDYHTYKFEREEKQQQMEKQQKQTEKNKPTTKYQQHSGYKHTFIYMYELLLHTMLSMDMGSNIIKYFRVLFGETLAAWQIAYIRAIFFTKLKFLKR